MIIQREPKRHGGLLKPNISQKKKRFITLKFYDYSQKYSLYALSNFIRHSNEQL